MIIAPLPWQTFAPPLSNEEDGGKDLWLIQMPYAFAGQWARNSKLDVTSCTIITGPAVEQIKRVTDYSSQVLG